MEGHGRNIRVTEPTGTGPFTCFLWHGTEILCTGLSYDSPEKAIEDCMIKYGTYNILNYMQEQEVRKFQRGNVREAKRIIGQ